MSSACKEESPIKITDAYASGKSPPHLAPAVCLEDPSLESITRTPPVEPTAAVLVMLPSIEAESQDGMASPCPWGSPMAGCSSEEFILDCAFEACDLEGAGEVPVYRILEYLQNVTGQSWEGEGLRSLYKMLDPEERGVSVDLQTFRAVMNNWIADCRQEWVLEGTKEEDKLIERVCMQPSGVRGVSGASQLEGYGGDHQKFSMVEAADLMSHIENLEFAKKKLADQNVKLQRALELSDESVARLTEEITQLKSKLKSTQHALQHAKSTINELEDLKTITKTLEERNGELQYQSRQLEKEQQCLNAQVQVLQKENGKLLAERDRERKKTEDLTAERAALKHQLCDYERLISQKDMQLSEKINQAEELNGTVEEYKAMTQELKVEICRLQEQLSQTSGDLTGLPEEPLEDALPSLRVQVHSLCMEIEDLQQGGCTEEGLASPLCGVFPWSSIAAYTVEVLLVELCAEMSSTDFWCITEELVTQCREATVAALQWVPPDGDISSLHQGLREKMENLRQELEKQSRVFLQKRSCLAELKRMWEAYLYKLQTGLQRFKQLDREEKPAQVYARTSTKADQSEWRAGDEMSKEREQEAAAEYKQRGSGDQRRATIEKKVPFPACLKPKRQESQPSATTRTLCNLSLVPVNSQLVPLRTQSRPDVIVPWFWSDGHLLKLWQYLSWLAIGLLLGALLLLLSVSQSGREHIWTAMKGTVWPHLQLQYLSPPPV